MDEETKFSFFLAERLGMIREELLDRMTMAEAMGWARYFKARDGGEMSTDMEQLRESLGGLKRG